MRSKHRLPLPLDQGQRRSPRLALAVPLAVAVAWALAHAPPVSATSRVAGNVVSVEAGDAGGGVLVLDDAGHQQTILVPENTPVFEGENPRPLASLRRGDRVVVSLEESSPPRASRVSVAGPARARRSEPLIRVP